MHNRSVLMALLLMISMVTACDATTPEEHLAEGRAQLAAGAADVALIEFKNAAQKAPDMAEARFELGALHLRRGELEDALTQLRRAQELGFDPARVRVPLTRARLGAGDTEDLVALREELAALPDEALTPTLEALLAAAEASTGDVEVALARLDRLVREHPGSFDARMTLARIEFANGRLQSAIGQAEAASEIDADEEAPWLMIGEARLASGDFALAADAYERARQTTDSNGIIAALGLARARMALNEIDAARTLVDEVLARIPGLPQAEYLSAVVSAAQEDEQRALESLGLVLSRVPNHLPSLYLRGVIFLNQANHERALADLERVVAAQPGNVRARMAAAASLAQLDQFEESVTMLEAGRTLVDGSPYEAGYVAALGQVQVRAGNAADGLQSLARAVELQPDAARLRTQLAVAHLLTGESGDAEAELAVAADLSDAFPASRALLILVQLRAGKADEALASAQAYVEDEPASAVALNLLGSVYLARRDVEEGEQALRRAVEADPEFTPAWLNLAGLEASRDRYDAAREILVGVLAYDPTANGALERLLDIAIAEGDPSSARPYLEAALRDDPSDVASLLLLVRLERQRGDDERAWTLLTERSFPEGTPDAVRRARAELALVTGRNTDAIDELRTLASRSPGDARVVGQLALALVRAGNIEEASDLLENLVNRDADVPTQLLALDIELLVRRGELRSARSRLETLRERPDAGLALSVLEGDIAVAEGDSAAAVPFYRTVNAERTSSEIVRKLYFALQATGEGDAARQTVQTRLQQAPDDVPTRFLLAQHLLNEGDLAGSATEYERIDAARPDQIAVLNNLAWIYDRLDRPGAIELARRALALAPDAAQVQDTLGWMLVDAGQFGEAVELLGRAASNAPEDPEIRYHYAVALARSGDTDGARVELSELLRDRDRAFAARDEAMALLRSLGG